MTHFSRHDLLWKQWHGFFLSALFDREREERRQQQEMGYSHRRTSYGSDGTETMLQHRLCALNLYLDLVLCLILHLGSFLWLTVSLWKWLFLPSGWPTNSWRKSLLWSPVSYLINSILILMNCHEFSKFRNHQALSSASLSWMASRNIACSFTNWRN